MALLVDFEYTPVFYKNIFYSWASVFLIFWPKVASNVLKCLPKPASRFLIFLPEGPKSPLRNLFNSIQKCKLVNQTQDCEDLSLIWFESHSVLSIPVWNEWFSKMVPRCSKDFLLVRSYHNLSSRILYIEFIP